MWRGILGSWRVSSEVDSARGVEAVSSSEAWWELALDWVAREAGERLAWMCLTILTMLPGLEERVMTVVTPAEVASRAATILVDMPPVPREEPALETGDG